MRKEYLKKNVEEKKKNKWPYLMMASTTRDDDMTESVTCLEL